MFFILENVPGIMFKSNTTDTSPLEALLARVRGRLGPAWVMCTIKASAKDDGLPQNRDWLYIVGRKASFYPSGHPDIPPTFFNQVSPRDILNVHDKEGPAHAFADSVLGGVVQSAQRRHAQPGQPRESGVY